MSSLHVLSQRGDETLCWDAAQATRGDHEALAAIQEAERIFTEARAKGSLAFLVDDPAHPTRLDAFLPTAKRIIIVPRLVGG